MTKESILEKLKGLLLLQTAFITSMFVLIVAGVNSAYGGSATWSMNPVTEGWNTAANWMPNTVPNGPTDTATFGVSSVTNTSLSAKTTVDGIVFDSDANGFTITVDPARTLTISGAGVANDSGRTQNFVADVDINGNHGIISFVNRASAGDLSRFTNNGSTGGSDDGGHTEFHDSSRAGNSTFIANAASPNGFLGGQIEFHDSSTADDGTFVANGGEFNGGMTQFFDLL